MKTDENEARDLIRKADRIAVLTGAGVSAESGVPTFRGEEGLWKTYRPEQLANPSAFSANPELVWEWYQWRQSIVAKCAPNAGHTALAALEGKKPSVTLITQNVDGLHRKAGSENVLELHGNIWRTRCTREGKVREYDGNLKCACGAWLRPHIVWFGEALDTQLLDLAFNKSEFSQVFLCVGTSGLVAPANMLPRVAQEAGSTLIEVNIEPTPLSQVADYFLQGPSAELLPRLLSA